MDVMFVHLDTGQDGLLMFQGVRRVARRHGWRLMPRPWYGPGSLAWGPGIDGIIAQVGTREMGADLLRAGVPVVNCDGSFPDELPFPCVRHDGATTGRRAADHLLDLGLRRIGYLGPRDRANADEQAVAVRATAEARGASVAIWRWAPEWPHWARGTAAASFAPVESLVQRLGAPVGLVVWGVMHPVLIVDRLQQRWEVPASVGVVATAYDPLLHGGDSGISAVATQPETVGERAALALAQLVAGGSSTGALVQPGAIVPGTTTGTGIIGHPVVAAAMRYIDRHADRQIAVDDVAEAVATSRRTLQRLFQQVMGHGLREAVLRSRSQRALRMLGGTRLPVKEVARRLQFASASHLARTLRRLHGGAPGQWRRP